MHSMSTPFSSNPAQYLATSKSTVYSAGLTYWDPGKNAYIALGVEPGDAPSQKYIRGCSCEESGSECAPHKNCKCGREFQTVDGVCNSKNCPPCQRDRRRCAVRPGCECRRNAGEGYTFVCNTLCHGSSRKCANKVRHCEIFSRHLLTSQRTDEREPTRL